MKLSKAQIVRLVSLLECNEITNYQIMNLDGDVRIVIDGNHTLLSKLGCIVNIDELRNTQHTTVINARILGCMQSVIVDYDMDKGGISIARMTLEDELLPIDWSHNIEQLVLVELEKHLPKL